VKRDPVPKHALSRVDLWKVRESFVRVMTMSGPVLPTTPGECLCLLCRIHMRPTMQYDQYPQNERVWVRPEERNKHPRFRLYGQNALLSKALTLNTIYKGRVSTNPFPLLDPEILLNPPSFSHPLLHQQPTTPPPPTTTTDLTALRHSSLATRQPTTPISYQGQTSQARRLHPKKLHSLISNQSKGI
jgi:hypothetical protein